MPSTAGLEPQEGILERDEATNNDPPGVAADITAPDTETAEGGVGETTAAPDSDMDRISAEVRRRYDLVPEIGSGRRWYDLPYKFLNWMLRSLPRRTLSWRMRIRLNRALNFFTPFNEYQRFKIHPLDDPHYNLIVPDSEELTQGGIWVLELFPPSHYGSLLAGLQKSGWDRGPHQDILEGSNADRVTRARRGQGFTWSLLGSVASPDSPYLAFDAKREVLPKEFDLIELSAVQIGSSLTAVVAFIRLSKQGQGALGKVWKSQHEPTFEWRGFRRPHIEARSFAAIRATQFERERLHDLARDWLARRCRGYFAGTEKQQPVIDFNLFKELEPGDLADKSSLREPMRALGMEPDAFRNYISPDLPGAIFVRGEALQRQVSPLQNCWAVIGSHETVARLSERIGYGDQPYSASTLATMYTDEIRSFMLDTAIVHYTRQLRETASEARDTARLRHREFKPRQLEQLKRELLTNSLDLPVVARDAALLWEPGWRHFGGIQVKAVPTDEMAARIQGFDLTESLGQEVRDSFKDLLRADVAYRDVLGTVSALGASAASARLGRRALFVSGVSLLISTTALLIANNANVWQHISAWFSGIF